MKVVCCWLIVAIFLLGAINCIQNDIEGKPQVDPKGFEGVMVTLVTEGFFFLILYGAGVLEGMWVWP